MGALDYLPQYTYDDYKLWDGEWEVIEGIPYAMSPAPMIKHQNISNKIARYLDESLDNCKKCKALMPIDWKISENTIVQPDNLVICHKPTNEAYISKAPKIIFEILSKSTAIRDENLKYKLYEDEGVKYYIIVNPNDEVAKVYELKNNTYKKLCDATDETINFELDECDNTLNFNFSKIWQ